MSGDFAAFVTILEEGRQRVKLPILAYCLMCNHWHITGQDGGACAKTGGRVSAAAPAWTRSVCNWPNGLVTGRPDG